MAKRVRGSRSTHRPGGQGPSRTKKTATESPDATDASTDVDIDGAVESVSAEYTEIAIEETAPTTTKRRRARRSPKAKADSLESRVAAENVYVRADLRRIGMISVVLIVGLGLAYVLFVMMDLLSLY